MRVKRDELEEKNPRIFVRIQHKNLSGSQRQLSTVNGKRRQTLRLLYLFLRSLLHVCEG